MVASGGPYDLDSRLIHAMSAIEQHLSATFRRPNRIDQSFGDLASAAVSAGALSGPERDETLRLWDLRRLLAHGDAAGRPVARATLPAIVRAEQLFERLVGEPLARMDSFSRSRAEVTTVQPDTLIGAAAAEMAQHDFSALPVVDEEDRVVALLTGQDIAHWLGEHLNELGMIEDIPVRDVMNLADDDYAFAPRDLPQREARRRFVDHLEDRGVPLMALLITYRGTPKEPLLGIVTPWDLPYLTPGVPSIGREVGVGGSG